MKILLIFFTLFVSPAFGFVINPCPLDNRFLSSTFDSQFIQSESIVCPDSGCSIDLDFYTQFDSSLFRKDTAALSCEGGKISIAGIDCFYSDGRLYCPLLEGGLTLTSGGDNYIIPDSVPIYRFMTITDENISNPQLPFFFGSGCPLHGRYITGFLDGAIFETETVVCSETSMSCNQELTTLTIFSNDVVEMNEATITCSRSNISFNNQKCFIEDEYLYCPLVDWSNSSRFFDGMDTYIFPSSIPIVEFDVLY